jgi:hypothetical protein
MWQLTPGHSIEGRVGTSCCNACLHAPCCCTVHLLNGVVPDTCWQVQGPRDGACRRASCCFWREPPADATTHSSQQPCGIKQLLAESTCFYHWWLHSITSMLRAGSAFAVASLNARRYIWFLTSVANKQLFSANTRRIWLSRHQITTPNTGLKLRNQAASRARNDASAPYKRSRELAEAPRWVQALQGTSFEECP